MLLRAKMLPKYFYPDNYLHQSANHLHALSQKRTESLSQIHANGGQDSGHYPYHHRRIPDMNLQKGWRKADSQDRQDSNIARPTAIANRIKSAIFGVI